MRGVGGMEKQNGSRIPIEMELPERLLWMTKIRWLAVIGIYLLATGAWELGLPVEIKTLYWIGAAVALYNIAIAATATRKGMTRILTNSSIALDFISLAFIIHFSGGCENPLIFYYVFHTSITSITLSREETYIHTGIAFAMVTAMVLMEGNGIIRHIRLWEGFPYSDPLFILVFVFGFGSVLFVSAYFSVSVSSKLREKEEEVVRLGEERAMKVAELEMAYSELMKAGEERTRYIRKVAHELKAPLGAIQEMIMVLESGITGEIGERAKGMLGRIRKRIDGLLMLISDILSLSRATDIGRRTFLGPVDISEAVERTISLFEEKIREKELKLVTSVDTEVVYGEKEGIEEILSNLISNAIKYTPKGGMVEIRCHKEGEMVMLEVADTGIGISKEDLPHIFEEFFRTPEARLTSPDGTGLGLSIVKALVEFYGGSIDVESEEGKGTRFKVLLRPCWRPSSKSEAEGRR